LWINTKEAQLPQKVSRAANKPPQTAPFKREILSICHISNWRDKELKGTAMNKWRSSTNRRIQSNRKQKSESKNALPGTHYAAQYYAL